MTVALQTPQGRGRELELQPPHPLLFTTIYQY